VGVLSAVGLGLADVVGLAAAMPDGVCVGVAPAPGELLVPLPFITEPPSTARTTMATTIAAPIAAFAPPDNPPDRPAAPYGIVDPGGVYAGCALPCWRYHGFV